MPLPSRPWRIVLFLAMLTRALALAPSAEPPAGLAPAAVPQFVLLGFDDNPSPRELTWLLDLLEAKRNPAGTGQAATFDGTPVRAILYSNGRYWRDPAVVAAHRRAVAAGHELGNHTQDHEGGGTFTLEQWRQAIGADTATYVAAGFDRAGVLGFRSPFLNYNDAQFAALAAEGLLYDTSVTEGFEPGQDGTSLLWPYTLERGSPGNAAQQPVGSPKRIGSYPGLWEIPLIQFRVPADAACARYGVAPGLRARLQAGLEKTRMGGGPFDRVGGMDWNSFEAGLLDGADYLAILKHTLDLRLQGNRAPLMVGGHTALYPPDKPDRRKAFEEFIAYALAQPDVRIVTGPQLIAWLQQPVALGKR